MASGQRIARAELGICHNGDTAESGATVAATDNVKVLVRPLICIKIIS